MRLEVENLITHCLEIVTKPITTCWMWVLPKISSLAPKSIRENTQYEVLEKN